MGGGGAAEANLSEQSSPPFKRCLFLNETRRYF